MAHAAADIRAGCAALEFDAEWFGFATVLCECRSGGEKQKDKQAADERGQTQIGKVNFA
jgi:hypothetical protein